MSAADHKDDDTLLVEFGLGGIVWAESHRGTLVFRWAQVSWLFPSERHMII